MIRGLDNDLLTIRSRRAAHAHPPWTCCLICRMTRCVTYAHPQFLGGETETHKF